MTFGVLQVACYVVHDECVHAIIAAIINDNEYVL